MHKTACKDSHRVVITLGYRFEVVHWEEEDDDNLVNLTNPCKRADVSFEGIMRRVP